MEMAAQGGQTGRWGAQNEHQRHTTRKTQMDAHGRHRLTTRGTSQCTMRDGTREAQRSMREEQQRHETGGRPKGHSRHNRGTRPKAETERCGRSVLTLFNRAVYLC